MTQLCWIQMCTAVRLFSQTILILPKRLVHIHCFSPVAECTSICTPRQSRHVRSPNKVYN